jgi:hypothetical protein
MLGARRDERVVTAILYCTLPEVQSMKLVAAPSKAHAPTVCLATTGAMRARPSAGEGVRRDVSRLHPGRTGGSFEYAHVLSHMSERGGAGISAL